MLSSFTKAQTNLLGRAASPPDKTKRVTGPLTPPRLLGLLDKVKAFHCFKLTGPMRLLDLSIATFARNLS